MSGTRRKVAFGVGLLACLTLVWFAAYLTGQSISIGRSGLNCLYLHATGVAAAQRSSVCPLLLDLDEQ
jgi:hypothetical protein